MKVLFLGTIRGYLTKVVALKPINMSVLTRVGRSGADLSIQATRYWDDFVSSQCCSIAMKLNDSGISGQK